MKKCPFCAEEIQDEAVKCKHCGEFLDTDKDKIEIKEYTITCPKCGQKTNTKLPYICKVCKEPLPNELVREAEKIQLDNSEKKAAEKSSGRDSKELIDYFEKEKQKNKSNTQNVGCFLIILGIVLAIFLGYLGGLLSVIGLVVLIVGLIR